MFEKFLNMMNLGSDDEDNYDDDFYDDYEEDNYSTKKSSKNNSEEKKSATASRNRRTSERINDDIDDDSNLSPFEAARRERAAKNKNRNNNVVSYKKESRPMEVCIKKPNSYEDATKICDLLMDGIPVVVSLEGFDNTEAQRTMEFICGCIYALHGDMKQIQKYTFIFSPADINLNGDFNVTDGAIPTFSKEY